MTIAIVTGMTALTYCCFQNKTEYALLLIEKGSKFNQPDYKLNLPLHYAVRNGNLKLTKQLIQGGKHDL